MHLITLCVLTSSNQAGYTKGTEYVYGVSESREGFSCFGGTRLLSWVANEWSLKGDLPEKLQKGL